MKKTADVKASGLKLRGRYSEGKTFLSSIQIKIQYGKKQPQQSLFKPKKGKVQP